MQIHPPREHKQDGWALCAFLTKSVLYTDCLKEFRKLELAIEQTTCYFIFLMDRCVVVSENLPSVNPSSEPVELT